MFGLEERHDVVPLLKRVEERLGGLRFDNGAMPRTQFRRKPPRQGSATQNRGARRRRAPVGSRAPVCPAGLIHFIQGRRRRELQKRAKVFTINSRQAPILREDFHCCTIWDFITGVPLKFAFHI